MLTGGCALRDRESPAVVAQDQQASEQSCAEPTAKMRELFRQLTDPSVDWFITRQEILDTDPEGREALPVLRGFLLSEQWSKVFLGWQMLERYEEKPIPMLIELLDRNERERLQDTGELIYPGAREFYGHGILVDYDIDHLAVRAGWVLEAITFQDFGFRVSEAFQVPVSDLAPPKETPAPQIQEAVQRARDWWRTNGATWTRYQGLLDALRSGNVYRQLAALEYVRFGDYPCTGLDRETFARDVLPLVRSLAASDNPSVQDQAQLLLDDDEEWWWKWKQRNVYLDFEDATVVGPKQ
jgi:hypothetical protein